MTFVRYNPPSHYCDPLPPRCRTKHYPPFSPPIASRRIPLCRPPNCEDIQEGEPNLFVTKQGTLSRDDWLRGWVIKQLFTRGLVECGDRLDFDDGTHRWTGDVPPYIKHGRLGGWWADSFRGGQAVTARGSSFKSGSKLWTLMWNHVTNQTLMQAKEFALEAIGYLMSWGIASKIEVTPWYISRRVMRLDIVIRGPGGVNTQVMVQGSAMPDSRYLWEEYGGRPRNVDPLWVRYPRSVPPREGDEAVATPAPRAA